MFEMSKRRFADRSAGELVWQPVGKPEPADHARLAIDACLGDSPLADPEWNMLQTQGWIADIKQRRRTHGQAAALVQQWREAVGGPRFRIRSHALPATVRAEAVAQLVAAEARKTEAVVEFRERVLNGKLLAPERVDRWLGFLALRQGAKPWVRVYVSAEEAEMGVIQLGKSNQADYGYDTLAYSVPGTDQVRRILVSSKGILGWLHYLSGWLAQRFLWRECDATTFVLTDVPPPISESAYDVDGGRAVPALTRVVMRIDPTLSPREVTKLYREIRLRYFGRRHRPMTAKHVALARFWSSKGEEVPWKVLRLEWNIRHPKWPYKREQNFARDCTQARKRLLGQNLVLANGRIHAGEAAPSGAGA